MVGHIKLDRKILNWEWYQDINVCRVFIHLLLTANYKDGRWKGIAVGRGQVIVGTPKLALTLRLSRQIIRSSLLKLKTTNEITINTTNKFSLITICKYDIYQSIRNEFNQQDNQQTNTQSTNNQPTNNQQITTNNNSNNSNKENNNKENNAKNDFLWEKVIVDFDNDFRWKEKFCRDKNLQINVLESKMKEFVSNIELRERFKNLPDLKDHFFNWFEKNKNGNGFHKPEKQLSQHQIDLNEKLERFKNKKEQ